jgi:hypothetical protein
MALNAKQVRGRYRMYGNLVSVTFHKRGHDQAQGSITDYTVTARQKRIPASGETFSGYLTADNHCTFQIWRESLDAVTAPAPNIADQISFKGITWHIHTVTTQLFGEVFNCDCERLTAGGAP